MFDLTDKTTLVTGAASGIGEAIAHALSGAGAFVYVADVDEVNGERVAGDIGDRRQRERLEEVPLLDGVARMFNRCQ